MAQTTAAEYQYARHIADRYRSQGYHVAFDEPLEVLPGYRADVVARRGSEVKVIEVRMRSALASSSQLDLLAQAIENRPGWSFELVLVAEPDRLEPPAGAKPYDASALRSRVEQAESMLESGQAEAAFLLAWSSCEAALRLLAAEQDAAGDELASTRQMLGQAASLGDISEGEYRELLQLQQTRNALVHGLQDADFSADQARRLLKIVQGIITTPA